MAALRLVMILAGDASIPEIDAHIRTHAHVIAHEVIDPEEAVTIAKALDAAPVVERAGSALRALWILDAPSRAAAIEIARTAPGDVGTLEVREAFTPEDFGAPAEAPSPPELPRVPGTERYIALLRSNDVAESGAMPTAASLAAMAVYGDDLAARGVVLGGQGLKASVRGARVRRAAAQRFVLDGPFAESKELVAGYMILQTRTIDEAVDEIRPWLRIHGEGQGVATTIIEVRRLR